MRVIAMKIFLLVVLTSCNSDSKTTTDPDTYYTCSMDPQVVEYKKGKCPICKMDLTPVKKKNGEHKDELLLSDQQIQLGNIQTDTIKKNKIGDQLVLPATLTIDQTKTNSVSSRVMGRVVRLFHKNMGDYVQKGSPLYEIYSEDLNNAKQEFILALDKKKIFEKESVIDFDQLILSAKNKLVLWGMNETQIMTLAQSGKTSPTTTIYSTVSGYITQFDLREGDYVMEGGRVINLADLSTLWVEAQVYASQMRQMDINSLAVVYLPDFENKEIYGKIEFVNPEINLDSRINLIRVSIPNPGKQFKPGMSAYVKLKSPQRKTLTLPIDAVIRDGKGATVWVQSGKNTFKSIMVQVGLESGDRIEITSGLNEGDIVVLSGAYMLHSEYVFKKGTNTMAEHSH
ncbi:MAG: efflux RND transporter periplasmic adaptor subunit [Bacteroidetes bacterium]|nr:efflux RND transporter periplasmic adaptor subunit [Bacteroidota bacterium]